VVGKFVVEFGCWALVVRISVFKVWGLARVGLVLCEFVLFVVWGVEIGCWVWVLGGGIILGCFWGGGGFGIISFFCGL
jgi:hypothetical protein